MKMINKILSILPLVALLFSACQKEAVAPLFQESASQRAQAEVKLLKHQLTSNVMGWIATFEYNNLTQRQIIATHFTDDGHLDLKYSFDGYKIHEEKSTYSIVYTHKPILTIDTHSYFASTVDTGLKGDFKFAFVSKDDQGSLHFVGNREDFSTREKARLTLTPISRENSFERSLEIDRILNQNPDQPFYRTFTHNGTRYIYYYFNGMVRIDWIDGGKLFNGESRTKRDGVEEILNSPIKIKEGIISKLRTKTDGNIEVIDESGSTLGELRYGTEPFIYPKSAALFQAFNNYTYFSGSRKVESEFEKIRAIDPQFDNLFLWVNYRSSILTLNLFYLQRSSSVESQGFFTYPVSWEHPNDYTLRPSIRTTTSLGTGDGSPDYGKKVAGLVELFHEKEFYILPNAGSFYFVSAEDPSIWLEFFAIKL